MKEKIIKLLKIVKREGIENLINWLENETDYFTPPASTKYHDSHKGGLAKHSFEVFYTLGQVLKMDHFLKLAITDESLILCTLLHDVCKTNFYKVSTRNKKNEFGQWIQEPFYEIDDTYNYGHGECSVMLIEKHIKLTDEERYAIRWHMGAWDESAKNSAINKVFQKYPFALALHMADMVASNMEI
jgi:hypothetical protein